MLHHNKKRKFGRIRKVRTALIKSLLSEFIKQEKIKTTLAKAKEIRPLAEKLVTKAKKGTTASLKLIVGQITKTSASKLFKEIAPKFKDRKGGYTRILKIGPRKSDGAEMAYIEFVE